MVNSLNTKALVKLLE